jgi:hypothetical protein
MRRGIPWSIHCIIPFKRRLRSLVVYNSDPGLKWPGNLESFILLLFPSNTLFFLLLSHQCPSTLLYLQA